MEAKQSKIIEAKDQIKIERSGFGYKPTIDYGLDTAEADFESTLLRHKELVKQILTEWEKSRENDVLLYFEYLRTRFEDIEVTSSKDKVIFKFPKDKIKFFPSPESITRARRSLVSNAYKKGDLKLLKELLPIDKRVIARRMKREKVIRDYFGKERLE